MGILVEDNENRSKLQNRIAADLRERAASASKLEGDSTDFVEDSRQLEATHQTTRFSWFWFVLVVLALLSLLVIFVIK